MIGILVVTHGDFASGILHSISMIAGQQENIAAVSLQEKEGPEDFLKKVENAVAEFDDPEEVLVMADLWGGSPFLQIKNRMEQYKNWALITGVNFPMLLDAVFSRMSAGSVADLVKDVVKSGKNGIKSYSEEK